MDILSSLATLSYDKRRSEFFTKELLILRLIDSDQIDYETYMDLGLGHLDFSNLCHQQLKIMQLIIIKITILI